MAASDSIPSLLSMLGRMLRRWWSVDRIRDSPQVGRLLRLKAGSLVSIEDQDFEVISRVVRVCGVESEVVYECQGDAAAGRMQVVTPSTGGRLSVRWIYDDRVELLSEEDVQVWR